VKTVRPSAPDRRAELVVDFSLPARLRQVDNARESVDSSGKIVGILASETLSAQIDRGLALLGMEWAELAGILETAKALLIKEADPEISYSPGVEMVLELTEPFEAAKPVAKRDTDSPMTSELERLALSQPVRTMALRPSLPSAFINLMFIGTRQEMEKAFSDAGWTRAAALKPDSVLETARAIIESRGYHEAPVSTLLLEGRPPELVFQKVHNTFAKRHHLRIWQRPDTYRGAAVWVAAATHDVGISFAPDSRTFFHTIDPNVDAERSKVVHDLLFTGNVSLLGRVGRPGVPRESTNATGDRMITDGKLAVLSIP
jgi:hypothetical protein